MEMEVDVEECLRWLPFATGRGLMEAHLLPKTPPLQLQKVEGRWGNCFDADFGWNRSFSEPDLTGNQKSGDLSRFAIKHPHEYIAVDDLKYFRRRQPVHLHTRSNVCLHSGDEPAISFGSLKSEYRKHFCGTQSRPRSLLRRATSLRLEGFMQLLSEHQEKYHWYTPEDLRFSRTFPVRNPENLQLGAGSGPTDGMKNSSYLMLDPSTKILPREVFLDESELAARNQPTSKLAADKFRRDVAAQEQQRCHLQMRAQAVDHEQQGQVPEPSEYRRQFVQQFPEKAHSIPQMSSIKIQGEFVAVPEYRDSFRMYANYSKSAPIKKNDNLRVSGSEAACAPSSEVPEYRDKFIDPPKNVPKEKSLKTDDHLRPRGEFTKEIPEYHESFRDPQITEMPERGKPREPFLRLRGKIEFNPEYRNNYQDFPRSRPVVQKPTSCFRLPTSGACHAPSVHHQPEEDLETPVLVTVPPSEVTATPEYRRAQYNYQLRERPRDLEAAPAGVQGNLRKSSDSTLEARQPQAPMPHKRRTSRQRQIKEPEQPLATRFDDVVGNAAKKPARYGRRASVLQNAASCRENSSIIEGNPKYAVGCRRSKQPVGNQTQPPGAFVVLDEHCKPSNWMKKTWYDS
uniref:Uncharacterized protein n=1 Tax=Drosophila melanogaster TaxID=7227 RepID=A1ZAZ8_DROME|nr:uncharacterized protein Dmel_CG6362 [Drosophila melanogaster]AAF57790.2 uncharacterized protein Dmel_CG6362 [Drosophila melanogaster]|eukprot:NP_611268.1 uncharacterized protein Dmel_CG6362 [Drosophila melanogaster]